MSILSGIFKKVLRIFSFVISNLIKTYLEILYELLTTCPCPFIEAHHSEYHSRSTAF